MSKIIKVFLKKCKCEKNKILFNLIEEHFQKLIYNNYYFQFYPLNKKQLKNIKNIKTKIFPMLIIENERIEGIKNIREYLDSFKNKKSHEYKNYNDIGSIDEKYNFKNSTLRNKILYDNESEEDANTRVSNKLNKELSERNLSSSNIVDNDKKDNLMRSNNVKINNNSIKKLNTNYSLSNINKKASGKPKNQHELMLEGLLNNNTETQLPNQ